MAVIFNFTYIYQLQQENQKLELAANSLKIANTMLKTEIEYITTLKKTFIPMNVKATGYAPLDPRAIEGMCYSGDPKITARGTTSNPNRTVAMGPDIPFGTQVYIPGVGFRIVEDRGGSIKNDCIDIMFFTQEEAFAFGVQENKIIFIQPWN